MQGWFAFNRFLHSPLLQDAQSEHPAMRIWFHAKVISLTNRSTWMWISIFCSSAWLGGWWVFIFPLPNRSKIRQTMPNADSEMTCANVPMQTVENLRFKSVCQMDVVFIVVFQSNSRHQMIHSAYLLSSCRRVWRGIILFYSQPILVAITINCNIRS